MLIELIKVVVFPHPNTNWNQAYNVKVQMIINVETQKQQGSRIFKTIFLTES